MRRASARVLTALTMAVVLLVVGLVAFIGFFDPNQYKDDLSNMIGSALGREVRIQGGIEYGFKPLLAFVVHDVTVMQPPGFGDEPFARIGRLWMEIKPLPLLDRKLEVFSGGAEDAVFNAVRNATGGDNFSDLLLNMAKYRAAKEADGNGPGYFQSVSLPSLKVDNATFTYVDHEAGDTFNAKVVDLKIGKARPGRPVDFATSLSFSASNPDLSLTARVQGQALLDLEMDLAGLRNATANVRFEFRSVPGDAARGEVTALMHMDLENGTVVLAERFKGKGAGLAAEGNGTVTWLDDKVFGRGVVAASLLDGSVLEACLFPNGAPLDLSKLKGAALSGRVAADAGGTRLENLLITALGSRITGSAGVALGRAPRIDFNLRADRLDQAALMTLWKPGGPYEAPDPAAFLDRLGRPLGAAIKGRLAVDRIERAYPTKAALEGSLEANGALDLSLDLDGLYQGRVKLDLKAGPRTGKGAVSARTRAENVDALSLARDAGLPETLSGRGGVDIRAETVLGESRAMVRNLRGRAGLVVRNAAFLGDKGEARMRFARVEAGTYFKSIAPENKALTEFSFPLDLRATLVGKGGSYRLDANVNGSARAGLSPGWLRLASGRLRASMEHPDMPGKGRVDLAADVSLDTARDSLALKDVRLHGLGETVTGQADADGLMAGEPAYSGKFRATVDQPRRLLALLGAEPPAMANPDALTRMALASDFNGTDKGLTLRSINGLVDATSFHGWLTVNRFVRPVFTFNLRAESLDLDNYLPLAPPEDNATMPTEPEPWNLKALDHLDGRGRLDLAKLHFLDMDFDKVEAEVWARPGGLVVKEIRSGFYGGDFKGTLRLRPAGGELGLKLDIAAKRFQAGPFLRDLAGDDYVRGNSDLVFDLRSSGNSALEVLKGLRGTASLEVRDGSYNFNESQAPASGRDSGPLGQDKDSKEKRTVFTEAGATFTVAQGVFRTNDFSLRAPLISATGQGNFSLPANTIDLHFSFDLVGAPKVPVVISGQLSDPDAHVPKGKLLGGAVEGIVNSIFRPLRFMRDLILR